jgi:hypothetical protein
VPLHAYEIRPAQRSSRRRSDFRCAAVRSAVVPEPDDAVEYAEFYSRSHRAVIRVDEAGNVIQTHEHDALWTDQQSIAPNRAERLGSSSRVDLDLSAQNVGIANFRRICCIPLIITNVDDLYRIGVLEILTFSSFHINFNASS